MIRYYVSDGDIIMSVPPVDNPYPLLDNKLHRTLTYMYLHAYHFYLLLVPKNLCADYSYNSIPAITDLSDPRVWHIALFYGFLIISCSISLYKTYQGKCSFGNGVFQFTFGLIIATFLPCTNVFFPVGFVVADRTLYIPSIGFVIFMAFALIKFKKIVELPWPGLYSLLIIVISFYVGRTLTRNLVWQSEYDLWESDALNCAKGSAKANNNFSWRLMNDKKDYDAAVKHARIGTELECQMYGHKDCKHSLHTKRVGYVNLRDSLRMQGIEFAKAHEIQKAADNFKQLTELVPNYILGWQFYAKANAQMRKNDKVRKIQETCAKRNPKKKEECFKRI